MSWLLIGADMSGHAVQVEDQAGAPPSAGVLFTTSAKCCIVPEGMSPVAACASLTGTPSVMKETSSDTGGGDRPWA